MNIKILRNCSAGDKSFSAGKTYQTGKDLSVETAEALLRVPNTAIIKEPKKASKSV